MIGDEMLPGFGDQRSEAGDEVVQAEHDVSGAVAEGPAELAEDALAIGGQGQLVACLITPVGRS